MSTLHMYSPAKINLSLRVVGRRADGYHLLQMVMVPLVFGDDLEIGVLANASPVVGRRLSGNTYESGGVVLTTDDTSVPLDEHHLCVRAARAMRSAAQRDDAIAIHLTKRIPVGGGLGGGSSNAGAVLRALNILWGLDWEPEQLAEIGVQLGADVPFFCYDGPAWVQGIGERVTPMAVPSLWVLLVNPQLHVSTPEVFHALGFKLTGTSPGDTRPPALSDYAEVVQHLQNDLESVTLARHPVIGVIKARLTELGGAALMSGSGATVFGLFPSQQARDAAAEQLQGSGWWMWKTKTSA